LCQSAEPVAVTARNEGGNLDAELAAFVVAWPSLPEVIKAAIRAMIQTVK